MLAGIHLADLIEGSFAELASTESEAHARVAECHGTWQKERLDGIPEE
jgi:hypothetical protein